MVLYTLLHRDEIFPNDDQSYKFIQYDGKTCHVRKNEWGGLQIVQLISTDPNDFLNAQYSPGNIIPGNEQR